MKRPRKGPPSLRPLDVLLWTFDVATAGAWKVLFWGYNRIEDYEARKARQEKGRR